MSAIYIGYSALNAKRVYASGAAGIITFMFLSSFTPSPDAATAERMLAALIPRGRDVVVLAIGSDRVTGDSLGPIVGHMLALRGAEVYGDLRSPVTALNVMEVYELIRKRHPSAFVIAVDSAVGADADVGKIKVLPRGLRPAAVSGKKFPRVGGASVIGVVSPERLGAKGLSGVRLGDVLPLAGAVSACITNALRMSAEGVGNRSSVTG